MSSDPPATPPKTIRLGTRGSLLARTQSQLVADLLTPHLRALNPSSHIELVTITTSGDHPQTGPLPPPLSASGGKGLFTKELEQALLENTIDFAVHSAKDLPTLIPPGLLLAATPQRELPNDIWIGHKDLRIDQIPHGALVGTTSLRRQAQLLALRPDVTTVPLRGNIDTRLRKVAHAEGGIAGTFLAAAGLRRTNLLPPNALQLPTDQFIPAAGQGTLALECRAADLFTRQLLATVHDAQTFMSLEFERAIIAALAGSCLAPIAVCAEPTPPSESPPLHTGWIVRALVASPDGKNVARATLTTEDPAGLRRCNPCSCKHLSAVRARHSNPSRPPTTPPPTPTVTALRHLGPIFAETLLRAVGSRCHAALSHPLTRISNSRADKDLHTTSLPHYHLLSPEPRPWTTRQSANFSTTSATP